MNDERRPLGRPRQFSHRQSTAAGRRLAPALVLYARAAELERLAVVYGLRGHERRHSLGVDLAGRVEHLADLQAAA